MPRHPGIQKQMRLEEIAKQIAYASGGIQVGFNQMRKLESEAVQVKKEISAYQEKLNNLLTLQGKLIECQQCSEFGLPPEITNEKFTQITGHQITS